MKAALSFLALAIFLFLPACATPPQVVTQVRIIRTTQTLDEIIASLDPKDRAAFTPKNGVITLDEHAEEILLRAIQRDPLAVTFSAPRTTSNVGEPAAIAITTPLTYDAAFTKNKSDWSPQQKTIDTGLIATFATTPSADRATNNTQFSFEFTTLCRREPAWQLNEILVNGMPYPAEGTMPVTDYDECLPLPIEVLLTSRLKCDEQLSIPAGNAALLVGKPSIYYHHNRPGEWTSTAPEMRPLLAKLSKTRVSLSSRDTVTIELGAAVDRIAKQVDMRLDIRWKVLEAVGITKPTQIAADFQDVSALNALKMIFNDAATEEGVVDLAVKEDRIIISTADDLRKNQRVTRTYDVTDLLGGLRIADTIVIQPNTAGDVGEKLLFTIAENVSPPTWKTIGEIPWALAGASARDTMRLYYSILIVTTDPENHAAVSNLLNRLREMHTYLILIRPMPQK